MVSIECENETVGVGVWEWEHGMKPGNETAPLPPGHALEDSRHYGWEVPEDPAHKWEEMVEAIQAHIGSLNWGYRTALRKKEVKYLNALAEFVDPHTIRVRHVISVNWSMCVCALKCIISVAEI